MLKFILRRVLWSIPVLLAIVFTFLGASRSDAMDPASRRFTEKK